MQSDHNSPNAVQTSVTQRAEDQAMAMLPKPIADWIRYDAQSDVCIKEIYRAWRRGMSTNQIMSELRGQLRRETREIYGAGHPQAAYA